MLKIIIRVDGTVIKRNIDDFNFGTIAGFQAKTLAGIDNMKPASEVAVGGASGVLKRISAEAGEPSGISDDLFQ